MMLMKYCHDRLFEWVMTAAMLGLAAEIAVWPGTIGASAFRFILSAVSAQNMGLFFFAFGLMLCAAVE